MTLALPLITIETKGKYQDEENSAENLKAPKARRKMREALKVWIRNEKKIEEAIINGEETQVVESDFGANEFVIDFLKEAGFWNIITGMMPEIKKDNGYPSKIILGTLIMKELLCIGKLSGVGKILEDGKLMADIGFNIEKIKKAEEKEKGVIDLGTLRNHQLRCTPVVGQIKLE